MSHYLEDTCPQPSPILTDTTNISEEIMPLVMKLIGLCASQGLFIKIINRSTVVRSGLLNKAWFEGEQGSTDEYLHLSYHNFGLAFEVGIYESSAFGRLKYLDHQMLYDKVGQIGETIGLNWACNNQLFKHLRYFELRPTWAAEMSDRDMINELYRRKQAKLSLLAPMEIIS
jgi:peptidoglycan L-alanyl-D-glutamate endopeptidase CwlK